MESSKSGLQKLLEQLSRTYSPPFKPHYHYCEETDIFEVMLENCPYVVEQAGQKIELLVKPDSKKLIGVRINNFSSFQPL